MQDHGSEERKHVLGSWVQKLHQKCSSTVEMSKRNRFHVKSNRFNFCQEQHIFLHLVISFYICSNTIIIRNNFFTYEGFWGFTTTNIISNPLIKSESKITTIHKENN